MNQHYGVCAVNVTSNSYPNMKRVVSPADYTDPMDMIDMVPIKCLPDTKHDIPCILYDYDSGQKYYGPDYPQNYYSKWSRKVGPHARRKFGQTMPTRDTLSVVVETDPENLKAARHAKIPAVAAPQQYSEIARVLNHNPPIRH